MVAVLAHEPLSAKNKTSSSPTSQAAVRRWHQESSPGRREPGAPWTRASVSPTRLSMMFSMESPRRRTDLSPSRHHLHPDSPLGQAQSSPSPSSQAFFRLSFLHPSSGQAHSSHSASRQALSSLSSSRQARSSLSSSRRPLNRMGGGIHLRRPRQEYLEDLDIYQPLTRMSGGIHLRRPRFVCCELFLVLFLATHVLSVTLSLSTALVHHDRKDHLPA